METLYYIRTEGYSGNALIWWRPNSQGYTSNLDKAGKYGKKEADLICSGSQTELAYLCETVDNNKEGLMRIAHADWFPKSDAAIDYRPKTSKPSKK